MSGLVVPTEPVVVTRDGGQVRLRNTFRPNQKQYEFFREAAEPSVEEILFHGSIRGGKSQACCQLTVARAMRYGGVWLVMRATKQELEDSTKKIMLRGDGNMPPALPPELISYKHEGYNVWRLINGAEIRFRSMEPDERGKIRNVTAAGCFIDQVEELDDEGDEDWYDELLGRLSDPNSPRQMILAANPGPETHWLVPRFGLTEETRHLPPPSRRQIHVSLLDNAANLDPDFVKGRLATEDTNPDYYKRMVLGRWGVIGGRRFKCWNPRLHVVEHLPFLTLPDEWYVYEGADWGFAQATAWEWLAIDFQGAMWVLYEHYQAEQTVAHHAKQIKLVRANENGFVGFQGKLDPSATWLDPSAWNTQRREVSSVADSFREHGIYPARAQNERIGGWARMDDYLQEIMPDGLARLRFWRGGCPKAILEIPNLKIKPGTEDVEKVKDHAADAVRYILMSRVPTPQEKLAEAQSNDRASLIRRLREHQAELRSGKNIITPNAY